MQRGQSIQKLFTTITELPMYLQQQSHSTRLLLCCTAATSVCGVYATRMSLHSIYKCVAKMKVELKATELLGQNNYYSIY